MLYLLLKVVSAVGMGLVLKQADARSLERLPLIRANYAVAAIVGFFASVALGQTHASNLTALLAAITGILFVAGLLIWSRTIQSAGLALSVVAMRTAVVIPLLAAAIVWRDRPSPLELIGAAVALLALALVLSDAARRKIGDLPGAGHDLIPSPNWDRVPSPEPDFTTKTPRHESADVAAKTAHHSSLITSSPLLWLLLLFVADGLVMIPALVFSRQMPTQETMPFQTIIFVSAFFVTTLLYYARKPRLQPETLKWGALLGTANFGNYLFLVLALSVLPGLVVYPVIAAGEVGLLALAGVIIWKEKIGIRSWVGIALAALAIVLIQLGKAPAA